jgi:hypothetical protein
MPCEGTEDCGIVIVKCCVGEKETPNDQQISNTQTIWQLGAGDEKSITVTALKIKSTPCCTERKGVGESPHIGRVPQY